MARHLRIEHAGGWYRITARGNERRAIFRNDRDRAGIGVCEALWSHLNIRHMTLTGGERRGKMALCQGLQVWSVLEVGATRHRNVKC